MRYSQFDILSDNYTPHNIVWGVYRSHCVGRSVGLSVCRSVCCFVSAQFLINYLTDFNEILETFLETPIRGMKTEVCCLQKKKLNFTGNFFNCHNIFFFNWKDFQRKPICAFEKICPPIQFLIIYRSKYKEYNILLFLLTFCITVTNTNLCDKEEWGV